MEIASGSDRINPVESSSIPVGWKAVWDPEQGNECTNWINQNILKQITQ